VMPQACKGCAENVLGGVRLAAAENRGGYY
jgi:hypothetical protein